MVRKIQGAWFAMAMGLTALLSGCANNDGAACDPACGDFEVCCEGTCVFTTADPNNCGGCGITCPSGICSTGTCMPGGGVDAAGRDAGGGSGMCGAGCNDTGEGATHRCCGGTCLARAVPQGTNGTTDPSFNNCNGCGIGCDPMRANSCSVPGGGAGTARCMCGDFDACVAGDVCVNEGGTYSCVNTSTDTMNCGGLGNACAPGEACLGGMCTCGGGARCGGGEACCAGTCIDVSNDVMNCGGCGVACGPNAPNCNSGVCGCGTGPACRAPSSMGGGLPIPIPIPGTGGDPGQLCCAGACVDQTTSNCGECGNACMGEEICGVSSGIFGMGGGGVEVCCMEDGIGGILGCGTGGGFPFPFPDGGGFPIDAGI